MSIDSVDGLARRIAELSANDPQFAAAKPIESVAQSVEKPGMRLPEIVQTVLAGYADRIALGQRAVEFVTENGRTVARLLPKYDTITYRELWDQIRAVAAALHADGVKAGDRVAILGFTSTDYTVIDTALGQIGAVSVPLQTSSAASSLLPIVAETEPVLIAVSAGYVADAVELAVGGPAPARILEEAAAADISVVRTYGMSETAGGCVYDGSPLDGVDVRVEDDGRIVLGGATLASGYRNPPDPDPFAEPGWFRTDDVGALDDSGSLRVLGRADDAISTGGLTVLPQPVESALATHPAIADCAVFGVADDRLGQRVVAAVVLRPGAAAPGLDELRTHVEATLPRTAAPRELHIVDEVPRRGIGKIDRQALLTRFGP